MKQRILIVDDDPRFLEMMQDILMDAFDIAVAEDIFDASNLLLMDRYDLLLLDVRMPVVTGLEYIQMLETKSQFANLPILVVSGDPDLEQKVQPTPLRSCLEKPFERDQLFERIQQLLQVSRSGATAENI